MFLFLGKKHGNVKYGEVLQMESSEQKSVSAAISEERTKFHYRKETPMVLPGSEKMCAGRNDPLEFVSILKRSAMQWSRLRRDSATEHIS